jgi:colicin import membrane protein
VNSWQINAASIFATLFIHGVIVYFTIVGWQLTTPVKHKAVKIEFVKAELVSLKTVEAPKPKAVKPKPIPPKPTPKPKPKEVAPEPVVKKETAPKLEPKVEAVAVPKEIDKGALQREQVKIMQDLLAQEEAQKLADEEIHQQIEEDEAIANSYIAVIVKTITSRWSRPPSARNGMEVTVGMQLTPNGQVVDASVITSSGDSAFDRSAIRAIKQAEQFPEIKNMPSRVFEAEFRNLKLVFRPEDLLL